MAEHARLIQFRRLRAGDIAKRASLVDGAVLVVFSRRSALRRSLRSRVLILMETTLEGPFGAIHAARPMAVLITLVKRFPRSDAKRWVPEVVRATKLRCASDDLDEAWRERSRRAHAAFWNVRRQREASIRAQLNAIGSQPFQAGLFDLRGERARAEERSRHEQLGGANRADLLELIASPLQSIDDRVTLVLVPWRS